MDYHLTRFDRVRLQIICSDITGFLSKAAEHGIALYELNCRDSLSASVIVNWRQYRRLAVIARKYGAYFKSVEVLGPFRNIRRMTHRPVLMFGIALLVLLTIFLPNRILLLEVQGNTKVATNKILEQAASCGITIGTSSRLIRSENIKNALLVSLPELQWAGINTFGSRAVISVKERPEVKETPEYRGVSSMVAVREGVIRSCTATKGLLLCQPGQTVQKGDVLISGYTDCGLMIRATQAAGEVIADTKREMTVVVPLEYNYRGKLIGQKTKISVIIGKKRINLFKDSGILGAGCVKIYEVYPLELPGGFTLPISLVVEQYFTYSVEARSVAPEACLTVASEYARHYLLENMISGRIIDSVVDGEEINNFLVFHGLFSCTEMIGRAHEEGIANLYGKTD